MCVLFTLGRSLHPSKGTVAHPVFLPIRHPRAKQALCSQSHDTCDIISRQQEGTVGTAIPYHGAGYGNTQDAHASNRDTSREPTHERERTTKDENVEIFRETKKKQSRVAPPPGGSARGDRKTGNSQQMTKQGLSRKRDVPGAGATPTNPGEHARTDFFKPAEEVGTLVRSKL